MLPEDEFLDLGAMMNLTGALEATQRELEAAEQAERDAHALVEQLRKAVESLTFVIQRYSAKPDAAAIAATAPEAVLPEGTSPWLLMGRTTAVERALKHLGEADAATIVNFLSQWGRSEDPRPIRNTLRYLAQEVYPPRAVKTSRGRYAPAGEDATDPAATGSVVGAPASEEGGDGSREATPTQTLQAEDHADPQLGASASALAS